MANNEVKFSCSGDLNSDTSGTMPVYLQKTASSNNPPHEHRWKDSGQYQTLHTDYFRFKRALLLFDRMDTKGRHVINSSATYVFLLFFTTCLDYSDHLLNLSIIKMV